MRLLLIFSFLFSMPAMANMSHDEIVKAFEAPEKVMAATPQVEERKKNIIPEKLFFGKKIVKKSADKKVPNFTGKGVDLSERDSVVRVQWNGTCTSWGLSAVIENNLGDNVELSKRHTWSKYKQYSCEAAINAWENTSCITTESKWPFDSEKPKRGYLGPKSCNAYLKKTTYIGDDIEKAIKSLDEGHAVYLGMNVTNSMMNCDAVVSPTSKKYDGGHAISIVGYQIEPKVRGGGYFKIKNSWGKDCGDNGYQYIPFYHCQRSDLYCMLWTIDEVIKK